MMMRTKRHVALRTAGLAAAFCGLGSSFTLASARAAAVTACGQVVSGNAYLQANLDCSAQSGFAVTIDGGKLDLRGFTLKGSSGGAVLCNKACKVMSDPPGGNH